ncbi:MAG: TolC family protein, partial [Bacteroidetes bacterium]|nr:TolC family protein [Bacteroidota bacterium]
AIATALEHNFGIQIQKKSVDISKLNNTWGNAGALPTVSFQGSASESWNYYEDDDSQTSLQNATLKLDWVVFRGYGARIQKSRFNEIQNLSETTLALITENTIVSVSLAYYRVLLMLENMKSAKENMKLSEDRLNKENLKKEIGTSKSYDLLQSQNAWLEDKSNYLSAKSNYNNSIRQMNFIMASPLEDKYIFIEEFSADIFPFEKDVLMTKLISNNSNLRNQYINLKIAKLDVKSAKISFYPSITAGVNTAYSNSVTEYSTNTNLNQDLNGISAGLSAGISYTLFNGGQRKKALQTAKIEEEICFVETKQMEDELKNQLAQEFEIYEVRKELLLVASETVKATELNLNISTQKYESGVINSFNFRDVQLAYMMSVWNYHNAIYNVLESHNSLLQLTGGIIEKL